MEVLNVAFAGMYMILALTVNFKGTLHSKSTLEFL